MSHLGRAASIIDSLLPRIGLPCRWSPFGGAFRYTLMQTVSISSVTDLDVRLLRRATRRRLSRA